MSLPGLSLPGLTSSAATPQPSSHAAPTALAPPRTEELSPRSELRFEVAFNKPYKVRLLRGTAEIFGTELAPNIVYNFTGIKGAIFTWHGCTLELQGDAESEYVGTETEAMIEWMNVHGMLETVREESGAQDGGPRVLVMGPDGSGKSSLVKCLTAWALKVGRTPTVVNLDSREGVLGLPGSLSAVTFTTLLDVEEGEGWGSSPISGPTGIPTKTPLVYHYPFASPDDNSSMFKALTTRAALAVTSKMEETSEAVSKASGIIIDTPGSLNTPRNNYEQALHIISEFSINVLLVLGSERLYNDMARRFSNPTKTNNYGDETITVLRISTTGGAINRDEGFMKLSRQQQIKSYFFGDARTPLNPHAQTYDFGDLHIYKSVDPLAAQTSLSFLPGMDDDDDEISGGGKSTSGGAGSMFEKVTPGLGMANAVLAIKFAPGNASQENIRDSCVMGFVYVAEVDETRKKVRFLAPHPSRWGDRALVWGSWPEGVGDLVA